MNWGKKKIAGVTYDLGHLDPFVMEVAGKAEGAPTYKIRVSFGCHTFTRELTGEDKPDLHFHGGGECRCFCVERYKLSLELPGLVRYASDGKAYFSERSNFLVVESLPGANAPYVAFFNVERAKKLDGYDLAMFIISAHLKPELPNRLPAVTFYTLIDYRFRGRPLKRPEPRKVIVVKRK